MVRVVQQSEMMTKIPPLAKLMDAMRDAYEEFSAGHAYVADTGNHRICVLKDGILHPFAGSGERGSTDGAGKQATFAHPCGLAVASDGTVFVADCGNHRIRAVTPEGVVSTVAGNGTPAHRQLATSAFRAM